jgi:hypothetical protein
LKHMRGMLFLAVVLSTTVPILADDIHPSFTGGDRAASVVDLSHSNRLQNDSASQNLGVSAFSDNEFRIESNSNVLITDFIKDDDRSDFAAGQNSTLGSNTQKMSLSHLGANLGGSLGRDGRESWGGGDGAPSVVLNPVSVLPTPEPGSLTLFLIGLAGLGTILYRRQPLKSTA